MIEAVECRAFAGRRGLMGEMEYDEIDDDEDYPEDLDDYDDEDEECYDCGGEGYLLGDCGEDSCYCANPETQHPQVLCLTCRGMG